MVFGVYAYGNIEMKREVLRARKIKESEMIHLADAHKLFQRLSKNDTVIVYSVMDFSSVSMFCKFSAEVINKGASLKIVNEHYLDIGNGKVWRDSVQAHINTLVDLEQHCYERLVRGLKLNKASAQFLADIIGGYSVSVLSSAFCNDGILHRG